MTYKNDMKKDLDELTKTYITWREIGGKSAAQIAVSLKKSLIEERIYQSSNAFLGVGLMTAGAIGAIGPLLVLGSIIYHTFAGCPSQYAPKEPTATNQVICRQANGKEGIVKFLDYKPFGNLDEVVLVQDDKVITLKPGDNGFSQQEQNYLRNVYPQFMGK